MTRSVIAGHAGGGGMRVPPAPSLRAAFRQPEMGRGLAQQIAGALHSQWKGQRVCIIQLPRSGSVIAV